MWLVGVTIRLLWAQCNPKMSRVYWRTKITLTWSTWTSTWQPRSGKDLVWKVWAKHGKHDSTWHLLIGDFYFEFSNFGSKMFNPFSYKLTCLALIFLRLMNEWIAAKIASLLTLLSSLSKIDTLIFFFA